MSPKINSSNQKGTADVGPLTHVKRLKLTREEMEANDQKLAESNGLSKWILHLYWNEPFYYRVLSACHIHQSEIKTHPVTQQAYREINTAGVSVKDARIDLWYSPDFILQQDENQIVGLLQHEAAHLAYGHCTSDLKPHIVANWAQDLAINTSIPRRDLPAGGWIPGEHFDKPHPEDWAEMTQDDREWFLHIDQLVKSFPKDKDHLYYYNRLMSDPMIKDMIKKGKELSKLLKSILSMDEHSDPDDVSDGDAQVVNGILAEAVRDAIAEANARGWGSVSADMQKRLKAMYSNQVPWQSVLRQFVGRCRRSIPRSTWSRRSRKTPGMAPGRIRTRTSNIAIFIDESGSMSDKELSLLAGELNQLANRVSFDLFPFDTGVLVSSMISWQKGMTNDSFPRVKCGGTDFQCVVDFMHTKESMAKYDGYVILTDGGASKPTPGRLRRAYILTPGNNLQFKPDDNDIVIRMVTQN